MFVFAVRDVDFGELEGFGDGEVDFEGGEECFGGLVVELEAFDGFDIGEGGGFGGELAEGFEGAGFGALVEGACDGLDFVADEDEAFDGEVGVVEAELGEVSGGVFADDAEEGGAFGVGVLDGFASAVGAEAVGGVAGDAAFLEEECAGVSGADVDDEGGVFPHGREVVEAAAGFEVDEASHFAIVDGGDAQSAGDADAVHDGFVVGGLGEDVGGDGAGDGVWVEAELGEGFLIALDDGDDAFGGGGGDVAAAEDVACEWGGLFEEVDGAEGAIGVDGGDHEGDGSCADVESGDE